MQKEITHKMCLHNMLRTVMCSTKCIHFEIKLIENKKLSLCIFRTNTICSKYAKKNYMQCLEKSIENDQQLLWITINYSFIAKFLIEIKTFI